MTNYTVTAKLVTGMEHNSRVLADVHGDTMKLRADGFTSISAGRSFRVGSSRTGRVRRTSTSKTPVEFPLKLNIKASTVADANRALELLQEATERARRWEEQDRTGKPVYLRLMAGDDLGDIEPVIGYRAKHLRLVGGAVDQPKEPLGPEVLRGNMLEVTFNGMWYPEAESREQPAWNGKGYLGQTRDGIVFSAAGTNLFTNPSFGHPTNYLNDWIVSANTTYTYEQVRDGARSLGSAIRITSGGDAVRLLQYPTLAATTYVASAYVRRLDGGTVTAADISVRYEAGTVSVNPTSYVMPVPGEQGWYRVYGAWTATAGPWYVGFSIASGKSLIVDDCQLQTTPLTPLIRGDMLGCTWSGTAHDSASVATASVVKFQSSDDGFVGLPPENTVVVWVRPAFSSGTPKDHYVLEYYAAATTYIQVYYNQANNYFEMKFSNNSGLQSGELLGGTATFSSGTPVMLAFRQSSSGAAFYENGVKKDSTGALYPLGMTGTWYLGCDKDGANQFSGNIDGFRVWATALTDAEIAALYAAELPIKLAGEAVQPLPVLWTPGGNRTTAQDGGTVGTHATLVGVSGDVPSALNLVTQMGDASYSGGCIGYVWRRALEDLYESGSQWFADVSGSALAGSWGGSVNVVSVGTASVSGGTLAPSKKDLMRGDSVWVLRIGGSPGASLYAAPSYKLGTSGSPIVGDWVAVPNVANSLVFAGQQLAWWDEVADENVPLIVSASASFEVKLKRSTGTANAAVDMFAVCPRPFMQIAGGPAGANRYLVQGRYGIAYSTGGTVLSDVEIRGDELSLEPGQYNLLFGQATDSTGLHTTTASFVWRKVGVRPRFMIYGY